jgi:hypothetical protein
MVLGYFWNCGR